MGGGRQCLSANAENKTNDPLDNWSCMRKDGMDLIQAWRTDKVKRKATWKVVENSRELNALDWETDYVLGSSQIVRLTFINRFIPFRHFFQQSYAVPRPKGFIRCRVTFTSRHDKRSY